MEKPSETDWEGLASMTDEEIDFSDIPPLPDTFFKRARLWHPQPKITVMDELEADMVELEADILEWFKAEDENWKERIHTALRLYVEANKAYQQTKS